MIWKNLIWNYTIRLWYLWRNKNSSFPNFWASKRPNTTQEYETLLKKFKAAALNTKDKSGNPMFKEVNGKITYCILKSPLVEKSNETP